MCLSYIRQLIARMLIESLSLLLKLPVWWKHFCRSVEGPEKSSVTEAQ